MTDLLRAMGRAPVQCTLTRDGFSLEELAALVSEVFGDPMVEPSRLLEEDPPNYSIAIRAAAAR